MSWVPLGYRDGGIWDKAECICERGRRAAGGRGVPAAEWGVSLV